MVVDKDYLEQIAQILARYLRELLISQEKRFSFETVFSHPSNLDIMERAVKKGYKVYLYFVSTESPIINQYRVALRVKQGGHAVPEDKIEQRYYRALELAYPAAEISYQAFFFDNSDNNAPFKLIGHFKKIDNEKVWDPIEKENLTTWFDKYYLDHLRKNKEKLPEII